MNRLQHRTIICRTIAMRFVLLCFTFIFPHHAVAQGSTLADHSKIKELSTFKIMGVIDLRTEKDISSAVKYRTLNHEGGMEVTVLEILNADMQEGEPGKWLYVLLTSPMWVDSGEWIEKLQRFLIFLPDSMPVFDFVE